jgi:hypothetical protein
VSDGGSEEIAAMPPMGGITPSDDELNSVAACVWAIGHEKGD